MLGSVAEGVVHIAPVPVLLVRHHRGTAGSSLYFPRLGGIAIWKYRQSHMPGTFPAVVYDNLNGGHRTTTNRLISFCMFTDPELARVGRNESEARRDGVAYRVAKMPMADVLRTETVSEPRGFLKMLIGANSDEILGFTAFGFEASEPMVAAQIAMIGHMPYTLLRDAIFTHPTMSEGLIKLLTSAPAKRTPRSA